MRAAGPRVWFGLAIAIWGAGASVPTLGMFSSLWPIWLLAAFWGLVYALRGLSIPLALAQLVSILVVAVLAAQMNEPSVYAWFAAFPGVFFFVVWMAPVGIVTHYLREGQPTPKATTGS